MVSVLQSLKNHGTIIMAGDFNGPSSEPFYPLLKERSNLESVFVALSGGQPAYTTWKKRKTADDEVMYGYFDLINTT